MFKCQSTGNSFIYSPFHSHFSSLQNYYQKGHLSNLSNTTNSIPKSETQNRGDDSKGKNLSQQQEIILLRTQIAGLEKEKSSINSKVSQILGKAFFF